MTLLACPIQEVEVSNKIDFFGVEVDVIVEVVDDVEVVEVEVVEVEEFVVVLDVVLEPDVLETELVELPVALLAELEVVVVEVVEGDTTNDRNVTPPLEVQVMVTL